MPIPVIANEKPCFPADLVSDRAECSLSNENKMNYRYREGAWLEVKMI